jgi:hypothetical protein
MIVSSIRSSRLTASTTGAIASDWQVGGAPNVETEDHELRCRIARDRREWLGTRSYRRHAKITPACGGGVTRL